VTQDYKIWQVIGASSVGTMIEWYDFYISAVWPRVIAPLFYPQGNNSGADRISVDLCRWLCGATVWRTLFGRIGDLLATNMPFWSHS
jgi:hypothetical protein